MKIIWSLIIFCSSLNPAFGQAQSHNIDKGFRLPLEVIEMNYALLRVSPTVEQIKAYIIKSNFKIPPAEALIIAKDINRVSACLKIDPWLMTALIKKESSFKRDAVSATGAAGLTQFTSIGLKEVNDQLGLRGREGAPETSTLYFTERLSACIDPSWIDLWNRVDVSPDHPEFSNKLKEELKKDARAAIAYGAILLKVYISFVKVRTNFVAPPQMSELYFLALQLYNGEEGDAKVRYAKQIFQHLKEMYPKEVNFPY